MPAPHNVWVILIGAVPTAFRAKTREELVPTFKQLQRTQPEVALRWFERGKVWENPEAARAASLLKAAAAKVSNPPLRPASRIAASARNTSKMTMNRPVIFGP